MKKYDWNNMSSKHKSDLHHNILILGPKNLSRKKIFEISRKKIIFGILKDEYIPGLKGDQFKTLSIEKLTKYGGDEICTLEYFQKDTQFVINELKPQKIIIINGSWSGPIHGRKEFWTILDLKIPVEYISPFSTKDKKEETISLFDIDKIYSSSELMQIAKSTSTKSYCWQVQVGAVIAKEGRILSIGYNKILPNEQYCMEKKCIREQMHLNPGQDTQICMANHAESEAIDYCALNGIKINGATMYLSLSPCPVCAKLIARSGITKLICDREYIQQNLGRQILEQSNISLQIINL